MFGVERKWCKAATYHILRNVAGMEGKCNAIVRDMEEVSVSSIHYWLI